MQILSCLKVNKKSIDQQIQMQEYEETRNRSINNFKKMYVERHFLSSEKSFNKTLPEVYFSCQHEIVHLNTSPYTICTTVLKKPQTKQNLEIDRKKGKLAKTLVFQKQELFYKEKCSNIQLSFHTLDFHFKKTADYLSFKEM